MPVRWVGVRGLPWRCRPDELIKPIVRAAEDVADGVAVLVQIPGGDAVLEHVYQSVIESFLLEVEIPARRLDRIHARRRPAGADERRLDDVWAAGCRAAPCVSYWRFRCACHSSCLLCSPGELAMQSFSGRAIRCGRVFDRIESTQA